MAASRKKIGQNREDIVKGVTLKLWVSPPKSLGKMDKSILSLLILTLLLY